MDLLLLFMSATKKTYIFAIGRLLKNIDNPSSVVIYTLAYLVFLIGHRVLCGLAFIITRG